MSFNTDECYCAPCDLYFSSLAQRTEHIQASPAHPECDYCKRRFLNKNILRNHFVYSRHHHYCASCEIEFRTPAGLRYHIEHAPVHCDDSDSEEENEEPEKHRSIPAHEWEEEMGQLKYPDEPVPCSDDDDDDDSWEAFDDYDYESAEELKDPRAEDSEDDTDSDEDADDEGDDVVSQFACPTCDKRPQSVCCAPCGHIFCSPCIVNALKHTSACPICAEPAVVEHLRKIFLA
ncbi:putative zinc-finger-containing protein [Mycena maculata]|uniref:Zinc-finger-containing protein n=1 Tax=Mycena maculata TaxID=230809 RepID=A0AAD7KAH4_9AGAR|nr:putative zinc-finger-containing protein [Mycena maculata]